MTSRQERLDQAAMHVNGAAVEQRQDADPAHEDFYAWGAALDEITIRLAHACQVLSQQIGAYGDNRILRDDEGMDPAQRIAQMQGLLRDCGDRLSDANVMARAYHSEASHLAVAVDPEAKDD